MQKASGLVPSMAFFPKVGIAIASVLVEENPIISACAAIFA